MKQVYRVKTNLDNRPQICGKARAGVKDISMLQALLNLESAAKELVKSARWAGFQSPINELRRPLLEIKLARRQADKNKS